MIVSLWKQIQTAMQKKCPRCGQGKIIKWQTVLKSCPICSLQLDEREGDCWAFVYFSMAALVGVLAIIMILTFQKVAFLIGFTTAQILYFTVAFAVIVLTLPYRKSLALGLDYYFENKGLPTITESVKFSSQGKPMNKIHKNILEAIGKTPIVKLNTFNNDCVANLYAKLEFINPGGSIKDRLGFWLIKDAEEKGKLKPGGTIIEGTSGNTGFGLAIAAAVKGYKCIFVLPDKMSDEKIKSLRAFGAKVVVTPTAVEPEDPRSYYSVSKRLAKETPNSLYMDQYNNLANRDCHYKWTGPEILEQMPDLDAFVAGIGTGGTICGVGKYLKEKKPSVQTVAVDPIGSLVYEYFKTGKMTEAKPYMIEGIGEDFIPENYDFSVIDDMVQVADKESFLMTRRLLNLEGIYCGVSCGAAVQGAIRWVNSKGDQYKNKNVLIVLPDSGNRYLSKVYDDDWMREAGFFESHSSLGVVQDLLNATQKNLDNLVTATPQMKVSQVIELMNTNSISQTPVQDENGWIKGVIKEKVILEALFRNKISANDSIEPIVETSVEFIKTTDPIEKVSQLITAGKVPLVTKDNNHKDILTILTTIDLITYMGKSS